VEEETVEVVRNGEGRAKASVGKLATKWTPITYVAERNQTLGGSLVIFGCPRRVECG